MASTSNRALLANYLLGQQSSAMGKNYISNPSAFMNTIGTSVSGSATVARNTSSPLTAISDFSISLPNNATDYVAFSTDSFDSSMSGKNCELRLDYTASSVGSNIVVQVVQGSNIVASSSALSTATTARTVSVNAPCGDLSTATTIRVANGSGNSGTSALKVANVAYGLATNLSQVSQAELFGWVRFGTDCSWNRTSTTFGDFSADGSCTITSSGNITTSAGLPHFTADLPPGKYEIAMNTPLYTNGGAGATPECRIFGSSLGSLSGSGAANPITSVNGTPLSLLANFDLTTSLSSETFKIQCKSASGSTEIGGSIVTDGRLTMSIKRFPSTSGLAYRPDQVAWRVDANISGANPSLGTASVSSYTELTNGSLTLTQNSGSIATQIACASGTASSGTTCTAANESVGIVFTAPTAGDVLACVNFSHQYSVTVSSQVISTFQIVETTNTSSAIVQEGKTRIQSGTSNNSVFQTPYRLCGTFSFSSAGQKTLRLQYEQATFGTVTESVVTADSNATQGQRDIHWEVYPITQSIPAPLLVGSVTSNSSGLERVERALISGGSVTTGCTASPCTIVSQSGSWLSSVTRSGTGSYTLNIAPGIFSGEPVCSFGSRNSAAHYCTVGGSSVTATSVPFLCSITNLGSVTDTAVSVSCQGPR